MASSRSLQSGSSRSRLIVMIVAGLAAAAVTVASGHSLYAALVGWDVAALVFASWVWLIIATLNSKATAAHATREDPGRPSTDLIVTVAAVASLVAVGLVLIQASSSSGAAKNWLAGLGVASVALSWFAVHTLFTLRYARLYYLGTPGGIDFNQKVEPRYVDFAYLAFTIGMTFQVSDTDLQSPTIRATALRHALISYLLGAVILATSINLIASLASK